LVTWQITQQLTVLTHVASELRSGITQVKWNGRLWTSMLSHGVTSRAQSCVRFVGLCSTRQIRHTMRKVLLSQ